ncbi:hypothetical protein MEE_01532 [Bartonella elizabethae F9251 = ATCC 49927]|uniref:Uncharacterized protein n=1 Tax=Bartonella elizabethae F9251 = ATCC 49927 TaxID=1094555 RepID=J1K5P9_BAREL|nr:hypothetical protein MEE_01532 [Bartonella elizabethae F9251 = ATCC 49927]VEJ41799.1 Uncharacterised protein [Bartonella elizabethae]
MSGGITVPNTQMNIPEIKLESFGDKSRFVSQLTIPKTSKDHSSFVSEITTHKL